MEDFEPRAVEETGQVVDEPKGDLTMESLDNANAIQMVGGDDPADAKVPVKPQAAIDLAKAEPITPDQVEQLLSRKDPNAEKSLDEGVNETMKRAALSRGELPPTPAQQAAAAAKVPPQVSGIPH